MSTLLINFAPDFRKEIRHILTKSVIETFLFSQILAKFEMGQRG